MFWHRRLTRLLGGGRGRQWRIGEGNYFKGSYGLTCVEPERLWVVVMDGHPDFCSTGEGRDARDKCGESFCWAKYTSSLGQGLWQRTKHADSARMSTAWRSMARPAGEGVAWTALRWMVWGSG